MKETFSKEHILQLIFILLVFVSCKKEDTHLTNTLLLEQSTELILSNQRELHGLISELAEINLKEKMRTSYEYEKISSMYDELKKFNLEMQNADYNQAMKLINYQNDKFKDDKIFKVRGFKFQPVKTEELNQLKLEVLKAYAVSKISRFYVHSAGYIFTSRQYGRETI